MNAKAGGGTPALREGLSCFPSFALLWAFFATLSALDPWVFWPSGWGSRFPGSLLTASGSLSSSAGPG